MPRFLAAALLVSLLSSPASAWSKKGHEKIAEIAWAYMNPQARAAAEQLLGPGDPLVGTAAWADDVRPKRVDTSTWHYINIPIGVSQKSDNWLYYCSPAGCVVTIVPAMLHRVGDSKLTREQRAEALKFVVHFVGDLHQPLHCGDNGDRGGNDVKVIFFDRATNLHSVWDGSILEKAASTDPELWNRVSRPAKDRERNRAGKGTFADWAWQAHGLSKKYAYGLLPASRPAQIDEAYVRQAAPVEEAQLRLAGLRLAKLLNETLGR